jgi:hypothetical protein
MIDDIVELQVELMEVRGEIPDNNKKIIARTAKLNDANKMLQRGYSVQDVSSFHGLSIDAVLREKEKIERHNKEFRKFMRTGIIDDPLAPAYFAVCEK